MRRYRREEKTTISVLCFGADKFSNATSIKLSSSAELKHTKWQPDSPFGHVRPNDQFPNDRVPRESQDRLNDENIIRPLEEQNYVNALFEAELGANLEAPLAVTPDHSLRDEMYNHEENSVLDHHRHSSDALPPLDKEPPSHAEKQTR